MRSRPQTLFGLFCYGLRDSMVNTVTIKREMKNRIPTLAHLPVLRFFRSQFYRPKRKSYRKSCFICYIYMWQLLGDSYSSVRALFEVLQAGKRLIKRRHMWNKQNEMALIEFIWLRLEGNDGRFWHVINLWASQYDDSFLTSWGTIRFSEMAVLHWVS
jgi:hypothetical protein